MHKTIDKSVTIPPYWVYWILGMAGLLLGLLGIKGFEEPYWKAVKYASEGDLFVRSALIIIGLLVAVKTSFHCTIQKKHLIIRFLGIPVRFIRWEYVSTAQYLYKWGNTKHEAARLDSKKHTGQGIIITLKGCPPFAPELDGLEIFTFLHPISSFFIQFTPRQQKKYVKIFQQYFPELSFQFGYEKNFEKGLPYDPLDL